MESMSCGDFANLMYWESAGCLIEKWDAYRLVEDEKGCHQREILDFGEALAEFNSICMDNNIEKVQIKWLWENADTRAKIFVLRQKCKEYSRRRAPMVALMQLDAQ